MHILIVVAIHSYMATIVGSAPLLEFHAGEQALVEDPQFLALVQISSGLTDRVLEAVNVTHKFYIHSETLQLNSTEHANLVIIAQKINMPPAPVLKVGSENILVESALKQMSEGLQLYQALLNFVSTKLEEKETVKALTIEMRDLITQINKMLNMTGAGNTVQPTSVELRLNAEYEVQVAMHLTLVHLQSFGHDMIRFLRQLDQSDNEETKS